MPSVRPATIEQLFWGGEAYPDWDAFNWKYRRFYLLNANLMLGRLRIPHSRFEPYLSQATRVIQSETDWEERYRGRFYASRTQIYPSRLDEPKILDKLATIVIAFELWATANAPGVSVYDMLRIVPAYYYLDGFTPDTLGMLRHEDDAIERHALTHLQQPSGRLLRELAQGFTVTLEVANALRAFIRDRYNTPVGEVRRAGADPSGEGLGTRHAAPSLMVPRKVDVPPFEQSAAAARSTAGER